MISIKEQVNDERHSGVPPIRIEIMSALDGVEFSSCYEHREIGAWDNVAVRLIGLADL